MTDPLDGKISCIKSFKAAHEGDMTLSVHISKICNVKVTNRSETPKATSRHAGITQIDCYRLNLRLTVSISPYVKVLPSYADASFR